MKKIGEVLPAVLPMASDGSADIVTGLAKRTLTPSAGYATPALIDPMTPLSRDEAVDIAWKLSTIRPWQISPDDQKAVKTALKALAWTTIPAKYEDAVTALTRLIAHFPRRDPSKDAVVVADIAADVVEADVSLVALMRVCKDIRKAATNDAPWFPPSGEVLKQAVDQTQTYQRMIERLTRPPAPAIEKKEPEPERLAWSGLDWEGMDDAIRAQLWGYLAPLSLSLREMYCRIIKIEYKTIAAWATEREENVEG